MDRERRISKPQFVIANDANNWGFAQTRQMETNDQRELNRPIRMSSGGGAKSDGTIWTYYDTSIEGWLTWVLWRVLPLALALALRDHT